MRVTIKDVAKLAGVAPSTVTRVIQNKSTISEATKERVRSAMKELDYHPNLNARSLVSQSSQVIALVLPDESDVFFQNPFFPTVLRGISQVASDYGYAIQICTGANETHRLDQLKQMIYGKRVDGLIFLYSKLNDPLVDFCIQDKFPFLILGKATSPFVSLVDNDNVKAAFDATEYFIKKGYQHIAFVGGNKELAVSQDRYKGYQEALASHQIPLREELVKFSFGFMLEENSYQIMDTLPFEELEALMTTDILSEPCSKLLRTTRKTKLFATDSSLNTRLLNFRRTYDHQLCSLFRRPRLDSHGRRRERNGLSSFYIDVWFENN